MYCPAYQNNNNNADNLKWWFLFLIKLNEFYYRNIHGSLRLILVVGQLMFKKAYRYLNNDFLNTQA